MKSTIKKSQKRSKLSIKRRYKIRKTLRFVRRKKLTRLKTYLRRAAPRTRDREVLSLWSIARPYLRTAAGIHARLNRHRLFRLKKSRPLRRRRPLRKAGRSLRTIRRICRLVQSSSFSTRLTDTKKKRLLAKKVLMLAALTQGYQPTFAAARPRAGRLMKTKITSALLRRKKRNYKKLTRLFLKTRRLKWLRGARRAKGKKAVRKLLKAVKKLKRVVAITRPTKRKSPRSPRIRIAGSVKAKLKVNKKAAAFTKRLLQAKKRQRKLLLLSKRRPTTTRWRQLQQIKRLYSTPLPRLSRRMRLRRFFRRKALFLRRARRTAPPVRSFRRRVLKFKLKIYRGSLMKLLIRRRARRKLRRLRRKVSKRPSARIRKAVLAATTHPVRRHLYYKRLLLTRRLGASIHRLRGLRPSTPQSAIEKNNAYSTLIVRGWRVERVHALRSAYYTFRATTRVRGAVKTLKKSKSSPSAVAKSLIKRVTTPSRTRSTAAHFKKFLAKRGFQKRVVKSRRRGRFIGPLTLAQALAKARERIRLPVLRKYTPFRPLPLHAVSHFLKAALRVKQIKSKTRSLYFTAIRTKLLTVTSQLRQLRTRRKTGRRARHIKRAKAHLTKVVSHFARYLPQWKNLPKPPLPYTIFPQTVTPAYELRAFTAPLIHTPGGRRVLIRQYFEVGQRARKHLYDPSPRVDHPPAPRFKRDSLRYKRRRVKERFALVAKIKRSLRRRRSHRRPVVIRKRRYLFTERSPIHTGRTVAWKKHGAYRYHLHHKLALTRGLFKELIRVKQPVAPTLIRTAAKPTRQRSKADLYGRGLLWTLLHYITTARDSKQNPLITRLCRAIRLFLRRKSVPAAPVMRLLLFKTAALVTASTSSMKNEQLLALERQWLSAITPHRTATLLRTPKVVGVKKGKNKLRQFKRARQLRLVQTGLPQRRLTAVSPKVARKARRFKRVYSEKVKRLLSHRKFATLLLKLKPRKWYSKRLYARRQRQSAALKRNWKRIYLYRRTRRFTICHISGHLRTRARHGEHCAAGTYPAAVFRGKLLRVALRQKLKHRAVKQRLADSKTELSSISRLQQQRVAGEKGRALADLRPLAARTHSLLTPRKVSELLQARLDSARLRARKALLWKAPLRRCPPAALPPKKQASWKDYSASRQKDFLMYYHQHLRRPTATIHPRKKLYTPKLILPVRRWRAISIKSRSRLPALSRRTKRRAFSTPIKKVRARGRLSRISRTAIHPKLLNFRTIAPTRRKKNFRAKKRLARRITALRRAVLFHKHRFFMRRRSTRGYTVGFRGKLIPPKDFPRVITRPLRTRMRRNKPLRRSLRRRLVKLRFQRRRPTRFRRTRASTGRVFPKLLPRSRGRRYWRRKKSRKQQRIITKKVLIVDQLLQRFESLADLRSQLLLPAQKVTFATSTSPKRRRRRTVRRVVTAVHSLLWAHRRITRLRRLRGWVTARPRVQNYRFTTLRTNRRRHLIRIPVRALSRTTSRRLWPEKTHGKRRWLRFCHRRLGRHSARTIVKVGLLFKRRKRHKLRVLSKRTTMRRITVLSRSGKGALLMGRKLLQKRVLAQKSSNKVNKKIAQPVKQPTTKLNSARIQSSNVKKQLPIKSNVTAKPSLRATPVLPRDFTRKPKQPTVATTPIKAPTAPVNTPFLKLPIAASLPRAATQKHQVNEPKVSAHPAKKIATFNKEKNAETVVAYSAIMSGLKAAWTALQYGNEKLTKEQLEFDAKIMEALYTKHYGSVIRFNSKALLDSKQYEAKLKGIAASSQKNNNKNNNDLTK